MKLKKKKIQKKNRIKKILLDKGVDLSVPNIISKANLIAFLFSMFLILFPLKYINSICYTLPFKVLMSINISIPIIAIYLAIKYKGISVFNAKKDKKDPLYTSVGIMLLFPTFAIFLVELMIMR